jgi:hypothetical protein
MAESTFGGFAMPVLLALLFQLVNLPSPAGDGFFYAIERADGDDRLYRIDWDGEVTPIGSPGAFGFPAVQRIVWDKNDERLYGYESTFDIWVEIDTKTSRAMEIGPIDIPFPDDMTFNPNDSLVYAWAGRALVAINPKTAEWQEARPPGRSYAGLAHVLDSMRGLDGFFTKESQGLVFLPEPNWNPIVIGGDCCDGQFMVWDEVGDRLLSIYRTSNEVLVYEVNQVTGMPTLIAEWNLPIIIDSIDFVPQETRRNSCLFLDTDDDGDIDLDDYAVFSECFTGPGE